MRVDDEQEIDDVSGRPSVLMAHYLYFAVLGHRPFELRKASFPQHLHDAVQEKCLARREHWIESAANIELFPSSISVVRASQGACSMANSASSLHHVTKRHLHSPTRDLLQNPPVMSVLRRQRMYETLLGLRMAFPF